MFNYQTLSDRELLKMVVAEKQGEVIVDALVSQFNTLRDIIIDSDEAELMRIKGIGAKRVRQIKAVYELARRLYSKSYDNEYTIKTPKDAADLLSDMKFLKKEVFKCILLNTKNIVIGVETVSIGTLNSSLVHPRETFQIAIKKSAASIIVAHNHPSNYVTPSTEDVSITKRLVEAGNVIGIPVLDHIIIGDNQFASLKELGIL